MPNYRRSDVGGGTFFFTVVTHGRRRWLCSDAAREARRAAIGAVRGRHPFTVDAWGGRGGGVVAGALDPLAQQLLKAIQDG